MAVRDAGDKLNGIPSVPRRWVVEVVVGRREGRRQSLEERHVQGDEGIRRIRFAVVPGGEDVGPLGEHQLARKCAFVVFLEGRTDEVEVVLERPVWACDTEVRGQKLLLFVMDARAEIQLLFRALQRGPADACAVDILELQALGEVVIEGQIHQGVKTLAEVLIPLCVAVKDAGLHDARRTRRRGLRDDRGLAGAVSFGDVDRGAIAIGKIRDHRDGAHDVQGSCEGRGGLGRTDQRQTRCRGAGPALGEARATIYGLRVGGHVDEVSELAGRERLGDLRSLA